MPGSWARTRNALLMSAARGVHASWGWRAGGVGCSGVRVELPEVSGDVGVISPQRLLAPEE